MRMRIYDPKSLLPAEDVIIGRVAILFIGKVLLSIDILRGNREIQHPHDVIFRV